MDLSSPKHIQDILKRYQTKPSLRLGQNFLIDKNILQKMIDSANLTKDDVVIEVGPGMGVLTQALAKKAKTVVAIEKDKNMVEILKETLKEYDNVTTIQEDILTVSDTVFPENYTIVANIPYYVTSHLIRKILESTKKPKNIILIIQKEVAQRIVATPPNMSLLALSVQYYAHPRIIYTVSRNCFWPKPKVDSAIIQITPKKTTYDKKFTELFFTVAKVGFAQKRKQLANNLAGGLNIKKEQVEAMLLRNTLSPKQRAETLFLEDWIKIVMFLQKTYL